MSRTMRDGQTAAFRAVITKTFESGTVTTEYAGPYATKGAASAAITRAKSQADWYSRWEPRTVTGYVETSSITWTRVGDPS